MEHIILPIFQLPCTPMWVSVSFVASMTSTFPDWNSVTGVFYLFDYLLITIISCFIAFPYLPILWRNLRLARKGSRVLGYYAGSRKVRFLSYDGQEVCFRIYNRPRYEIGQKLWVIYNPDRPSEAEIASRSVLWSFPINKLSGLLLPVILFILLTISSMPFPLAVVLALFFIWIISIIIDLCLWIVNRLPAAPLQTDEERDQTTAS